MTAFLLTMGGLGVLIAAATIGSGRATLREAAGPAYIERQETE